MIEIKKHTINQNASILEALGKLNKVPQNLTLFVLGEDQKIVGTLTDGDVRRGLLKNIPITARVEQFMTCDFSYVIVNKYNPVKIRKIKEKGVKLLPVLNRDGRIVKVFDLAHVENVLPADAVLMAGGNGERLLPLTSKIPKPLLKIGKKPIIEHNVDHLIKYGINRMHISVRYLGNMVEEYLGTGNEKGIKISYTREDIPLGTIGSLSLMSGFEFDTLLLINADVFTNIDFENFYLTFKEEKADMAVATIPYVVDIPYAILDSGEKAVISDLREKPSFTYYANAGIYIFKKNLISIIPHSTKFDATDFIHKLISLKKKIIRYPVHGYWFDIGKPEDYVKAKEFARHIRNM